MLITRLGPLTQRGTHGQQSLVHYSSAYASLAGADRAAADTGGVLVIDHDWTLSADTTLEARAVGFAGGVINRNGHALTFGGSVEAGRQRIFDVQGASSGRVTFSVVPPAYHPEWWGAANDGATDDYHAVQAALDVASRSGGKVVLRGPYHTARQLVAPMGSGVHHMAYEVDAYGAWISTTGPIYGLEVTSHSVPRGPVIRGLAIDHDNPGVARSPGGFHCHGAMAAELIDCTVVTSVEAVGRRRSEYHAFVVDAQDGRGSYWCVLDNCANYVPDDRLGHIASGVLVRDNSNAARVLRCRLSGVEDGVRIEAAVGDPNSVVVRDLAVETYSGSAVHLVHTGSDDMYVFGLTVDGVRGEPRNSGTYGVRVSSLQGGQSNSPGYGRFDNVLMVGGDAPYRIDPNCRSYRFHTTDALSGVVRMLGTDSATVSFSTVASNGLNGRDWPVDTEYHVSLSGDADERLWVTDKTLSGFRIHSSNPRSTATVSWRVTR